MRFLAMLLLALGLAGCYAYPYPYPYPQPAPAPDPVEVSWNAARGALEDVGLTVVTADRATGTLRGARGGAEGTVKVNMRADGRVGVEFGGSDSGLTDRIAAAYQRRMGR